MPGGEIRARSAPLTVEAQVEQLFAPIALVGQDPTQQLEGGWTFPLSSLVLMRAHSPVEPKDLQ